LHNYTQIVNISLPGLIKAGSSAKSAANRPGSSLIILGPLFIKKSPKYYMGLLFKPTKAMAIASSLFPRPAIAFLSL
jgi:hypothetical protein